MEMKGGRRWSRSDTMYALRSGYRATKAQPRRPQFGRPLFLHCRPQKRCRPHYITSDWSSDLRPRDRHRALCSTRNCSGDSDQRESSGMPHAAASSSSPGIGDGRLVTVRRSRRQYGYDVQAELCARTNGSLARIHPYPAVTPIEKARDRRRLARQVRRTPIETDEGVGVAYRSRTDGPLDCQRWDGLASVGDRSGCIGSVGSGGKDRYYLGERPAFYAG